MIMTSLFEFFAARREAALLLDHHGEDAMLLLSDGIGAAMRKGDERTAVRLDRILTHVENAVNARQLRHATQ